MRYQNYAFPVPDEKIVRVILDADMKNEADDPFAAVQTLLSPKFEITGLIAAHFGATHISSMESSSSMKSTSSMESSYQEFSKLLDIMGFPKDRLCHGAAHAMSSRTEPVESDGMRLIITEAMKEDSRPLYVLLTGPLTDIAGAYLAEPSIASRLTVIWIGGGRYPEGGPEFNLGNDIHAANVVFSSPMPVWQVPKNVYEMMPVSLTELEYRVRPQGRTGRYLFDQLVEHSLEEAPRKSPFRTGETWVLGDSPAPGLLLYEHRFCFDYVEAPLVTQDMTYVHTRLNRPIRVYKDIDSRLILEDFYCKLALFEQKRQSGT